MHLLLHDIVSPICIQVHSTRGSGPQLLSSQQSLPLHQHLIACQVRSVTEYGQTINSWLHVATTAQSVLKPHRQFISVCLPTARSACVIYFSLITMGSPRTITAKKTTPTAKQTSKRHTKKESAKNMQREIAQQNQKWATQSAKTITLKS